MNFCNFTRFLESKMKQSAKLGPIGVFDSGYGGLTILRGLRSLLPQYNYIYLGDNARAPYGNRSFEVVYRFTSEAVGRLWDEGCPLIILGCNTASAKALRTIQQCDLAESADPTRRVLGVILPTVERIGSLTRSGHIGIFGTPGTIQSRSYEIEIAKLYPDFKATGHACPMWVPLVENGEADRPGADYFIKQEIDRLLAEDPLIDTIVLGCTHYPLLESKIRQYLPEGIELVVQGTIAANSLISYLRRHPEIDSRLERGGECRYLTTENPEKFSTMASLFLRDNVRAEQILL